MPGIDPNGKAIYEDRDWNASNTPLHGADGKIILILQHTADITELEELRRARDDGTCATIWRAMPN